jgi:hypothetical protein
MKRFRKILKWIGIIMGAAIAILLICNACFVWSTGTRLEARLAALRRAGEPVQLSDLAREPIPPEKNADVFLRRAADDLDAIEKELVASYPKRGYPTGELTPAEQEKLEKLFAAYSRVMPLLEQAADCPDSDPQLDTTLLPSRFLEPYMNHSTKHRVLIRVSRARSAWLLSSGRADDALAGQILMLRLTRHWRHEPLLIGYLVTAVCEQSAMDEANRVLQHGPVSPAARQALDTELALHDSMEGYTWALRSERAFNLSSFQEIPGTGFWLMRGFSTHLALRLLDFYDRHLDDASRLYAQVVAGWKSDPPPGGGLNPYGPLVTLLQPALTSAREPADRVRAMSRSLRILNTLQVRVPSGGDKVPQLNDLGLPAEATIDPFNGRPLRVEKVPEGWMVYSVGSNGVDDGGKLDQRTDVGVGPVSREVAVRRAP